MSNQPGPWGQQPGQSPGQQPSAPGGWRPPSGQGWGGAQPPYPHAQVSTPQPGYGPGGQRYGGAGNPRQASPSGPRRPRSAGLIIGIVVAAVVLLIALGTIVTALGGRSSGTSPGTAITPSSQSPIPTTEPTTAPSAPPSSDPSSGGGGETTGQSYALAHGVGLTAAAGWQESSKKSTIVSLSSPDDEIFSGQVAELAADDNPSSVVTTWLKQVAEDMGDVEYGDVKGIDVGAENLDVASAVMAGTVSTSQGSVYVVTQAIASVRTTDGVTVITTLRYFEDSDTGRLSKDFGSMTGSMLSSQAAG